MITPENEGRFFPNKGTIHWRIGNTIWTNHSLCRKKCWSFPGGKYIPRVFVSYLIFLTLPKKQGLKVRQKTWGSPTHGGCAARSAGLASGFLAFSRNFGCVEAGSWKQLPQKLTYPIPRVVGKMSFLFHWWDMLVPWRVIFLFNKKGTGQRNHIKESFSTQILLFRIWCDLRDMSH